MKKIFIFLISITYLIISCSEPNIAPDLNENFVKKYPAELNNEWEYSVNIHIELYDSSGNIDTSFFQTSPNILTKVERYDSVRNSTVFMSKGLDSNYFKMNIWFQNTNSGLSALYYSIAFESIFPKQSDVRNFDLLQNQNRLPVFPCELTQNSLRPMPSPWPFEPPRQVIRYPLSVGMNWIEEVEPDYSVRKVISLENVLVAGKNYMCYKLESKKDSLKILTYDHINFDVGLVKRVVIKDSLIYGNLQTQWRYAKVTTSSNLIRHSIN